MLKSIFLRVKKFLEIVRKSFYPIHMSLKTNIGDLERGSDPPTPAWKT